MTQDEIGQVASAISKNLVICQKEVLTLDEAAQYIGMTTSALYKLTSSRKIPFSKPNGKNCFFRRIELEEWLMSNPVATDIELNSRAQAYVMKNSLLRS